MANRDWLSEEEQYLDIISKVCINLSKRYHAKYFVRKKTQTKLKIPAIIIGSFTGVASFGTSTFPKHAQKWVAIVVGLVNICIATLNTLDTFFKISEDMTSAKATSEQLRKLAEDIQKELCLPETDRPTSGIQFLREVYTRYQQIISNAPMLHAYISYADKESAQKNDTLMSKLKASVTNSSPRSSQTTSDIVQLPAAQELVDELKIDTSKISSVANYLAKVDAPSKRLPNPSRLPTIIPSPTSSPDVVPIAQSSSTMEDIETGSLRK